VRNANASHGSSFEASAAQTRRHQGLRRKDVTDGPRERYMLKVTLRLESDRCDALDSAAEEVVHPSILPRYIHTTVYEHPNTYRNRFLC